MFLKRRKKRKREDWEKVARANERWGTDMMYPGIGSRAYYLVRIESLTSMDGNGLRFATWAAIDKLFRGVDGLHMEKLQIRSDNGSGCILRESREVVAGN